MMINSLLVKIFRSSLKLANIPRGLSKGCYYDPANKHELKKHKLEASLEATVTFCIDLTDFAFRCGPGTRFTRRSSRVGCCCRSTPPRSS